MSTSQHPLPKESAEGLRFNGGARAQIVNRTHRVVRAEAMDMREMRKRSRGLWAPLLICSSLLFLIFYAVWGVLDGYDITPMGIPDASYQVLLLLLWMLPVTAFVLGFVWIRRERNRANSEAPR